MHTAMTRASAAFGRLLDHARHHGRADPLLAMVVVVTADTCCAISWAPVCMGEEVSEYALYPRDSLHRAVAVAARPAGRLDIILTLVSRASPG
jgi:hypothetical protein